MSSWIWVSNTLKNLRIGGVTGSAVQSRLFGAQAVTGVPLKPKKPLTPYFRFLGEVRETVKKENPNLKPTELMKKIALRWDSLDEKVKSKYTTAYKSDMEGYSGIILKYNQSLSPEQKELTEQFKLDKQLKKEKRDKKKRLKEMGKPKKPISGFLLFLKNKVPNGASIADYQKAAKELGAKWKTMSEAEKAPFVATYKKDLEEYEKLMAKWEEKMLKQGNQDLVRTSALTKSLAQKSKSK